MPILSGVCGDDLGAVDHLGAIHDVATPPGGLIWVSIAAAITVDKLWGIHSA